ncbi:hypothetical protein BCR42DRAFT_447919 [Absidia repens]|uniref:Uncharacterized protein n=1 Tax=Absidia repens TaxID=90262 RepID=A0A1X2IV60_9FUNG|nr:hypothetical protein BCR42DRAFT_447919 [Absidia repens]
MLSSYPCCYTSLSLTVRCMTYYTLYLDETDLGCSTEVCSFPILVTCGTLIGSKVGHQLDSDTLSSRISNACNMVGYLSLSTRFGKNVNSIQGDIKFAKASNNKRFWHQRSRQAYSKSNNIHPLRSMAIHQLRSDLDFLPMFVKITTIVSEN